MFFLLTNLLNFYKIYNHEKRGALYEKYRRIITQKYM